MAAALPFPKSDATFAEEGWEAAVGDGREHQTKTITSGVKAIASLSCAAVLADARISQAKATLEAVSKGILDISGVFRGRELTRKERRLTCGITPIDQLIGGGIVRGRVSEIIGNPGAGRTSLAAAFAASITGRGEVAAWIDAGGCFDPGSIAAAGVDLARMLWVAMPAKRRRSGENFEGERAKSRRATDHFDHHAADHYAEGRSYYAAKRPANAGVLKAAEWILAAGGFGLVVIDCGGLRDFNGRLSAFTQSAALRLAHGAERSGAAVVVIAPHRMCGTFAALSLMLSRRRACFSRSSSGAPALFDGLTVEARVMRNKLGGSGGAATWSALADPSCIAISACAETSESAGVPDRTHPFGSHDPRERANHAGHRVAAR
ncbi:MAG: recombination protein RecA [Candidatus Binataceae bacterium]|nr:recombination protein RecA [Candidatus Binataceae bacterium]